LPSPDNMQYGAEHTFQPTGSKKAELAIRARRKGFLCD
jgi:hypothetical protein